ncbi:MAG: non-reducing end alpha-L-arabinofuranosidase, partial [Trebonia sp.]|nr:non-reducing end alpha-L-arabinofuranosidase [Trebonia sp.]
MHVSDISRRLILVVSAALLVVGGLAGSAIAGGFSTGAAATGPGAVSPRPCDIYAAGATPCVAAYSTVRAMYSGYRGPLYRVTRASGGTSTDIGVQWPGGYA